jgi:hypothetical protein
MRVQKLVHVSNCNFQAADSLKHTNIIEPAHGGQEKKKLQEKLIHLKTSKSALTRGEMHLLRIIFEGSKCGS